MDMGRFYRRKPTLMDIEDISRQSFADYVFVQKQGHFNMMSEEAREMAFLTRDEHYSIISHYSELAKKFPEVVELVTSSD